MYVRIISYNSGTCIVLSSEDGPVCRDGRRRAVFQRGYDQGHRGAAGPRRADQHGRRDRAAARDAADVRHADLPYDHWHEGMSLKVRRKRRFF